jgi:hypothetical protein
VKVKGGWKKLHNKEFHDLLSSQNIIPVIKLKRMFGRGI